MPKSILVADDSVTIRKVIGMIFSTEDVQLTMVDNGLDAIGKARELRPDLVIADVTMPGKSGYEVSEAIKSDPSTQGIPVLLLAGTFEPFDENRANASGADSHIAKPFESGALLEKVRSMVGLPAEPKGAPAYTTAAAPAPVPQAAAPAAQSPFGRAPQPPPGAARLPQPMAGLPRPPGAGMPGQVPPGARPPAPGAMPAARPGMPGPMPGAPRPPGPGAMPGARPGMPPQGAPMARPGMPGPGMAPMGRPGMPPPGAPQQMRPGAPQPMARPGMAPPGYGQPPPPGARPPQPFGYGAPAVARPPQPRAPAPMGGAEGYPHADGGEAMLRDALSKASREVIEKIAWEVVPQLAETIIRENLERLTAARNSQG